MRDLNYELKQLCHRNRDGSHATQAARERILTQIANQLHEMGRNLHDAFDAQRMQCRRYGRASRIGEARLDTHDSGHGLLASRFPDELEHAVLAEVQTDDDLRVLPVC